MPRVDNESISDLYVAVLTPDGVLRPVIEGQLLADVPDVQSLVDEPPAATTFITTDGVDGTSTFRVMFLPGTATSLDAIVAVPVDDVEDTIRQLTYTFVGVAGLILIVLIVIDSWVNRFGLRPISAMTDVAEAISSGERDRRAEVDDDATEAGRLGHAFNVMLDERDSSETRLRQFVSNASHELRTPLTSIRGYLDLYAAGGFRNPGELDDAMRRLQVEAVRMNLLVEDLLVLAKFDEVQPLDITTFPSRRDGARRRRARPCGTSGSRDPRRRAEPDRGPRRPPATTSGVGGPRGQRRPSHPRRLHDSGRRRPHRRTCRTLGHRLRTGPHREPKPPPSSTASAEVIDRVHAAPAAPVSDCRSHKRSCRPTVARSP